MKRLSFYLLFLVLVLFSSCEIITNQTELSGTWKIKSLMANSEEYLYNDHVRDYAPDIAKSANYTENAHAGLFEGTTLMAATLNPMTYHNTDYSKTIQLNS